MQITARIVLLTMGLFSFNAFGNAIERIYGTCNLSVLNGSELTQEKINLVVHEQSHFGVFAKGAGSNSTNIVIMDSFGIDPLGLQIYLSTQVKGLRISTSSKGRPSAKGTSLVANLHARDEAQNETNLECNLDVVFKN